MPLEDEVEENDQGNRYANQPEQDAAHFNSPCGSLLSQRRRFWELLAAGSLENEHCRFDNVPMPISVSGGHRGALR